MSLVLYTTDRIDLSSLRFVPNETIYINDLASLTKMPKNITILPAVVKQISGMETVIQGEAVESIEPLTIHEQASTMKMARN